MQTRANDVVTEDFVEAEFPFVLEYIFDLLTHYDETAVRVQEFRVKIGYIIQDLLLHCKHDLLWERKDG
jgi:hypothetical protein